MRLRRPLRARPATKMIAIAPSVAITMLSMLMPLTEPIRLEVMTNPRPYLPNPIKAAEMIKAELRAH